MTPALPLGKKLARSLVLALVALVACAAPGAHAQSFQAQNVLVSDLAGGTSGRTYPANVQYWDVAGQEVILYTVPFSSSSFLIFEDFSTGLRYVACDKGCRVEALSSSFPRLNANTASTSRFAFGNFERTFALPSGGLQTLSARPTLPAACAADSAKGSLVLTTDPCLPYGLPCGTSCLCLGCTDGDQCTVDDTCGLSKFGVLTCTGLETCNRTAKTVIAIDRHRGGGSGTAVALGVALGVGIGVPVAVLLLFLCLVLPLILLPLLWRRRRERRPTVVRTTAAPVAAAAVPVAAAGYAPATYMTGPAGTPVAVGNPLYAEPWRTAAMPQGVTGAAGAPGTPAGGIARDIPVYP